MDTVVEDALNDLQGRMPAGREPAPRNFSQEKAWLHGWYRKARNNRQEQPKVTHLKRRTRRVGR